MRIEGFGSGPVRDGSAAANDANNPTNLRQIYRDLQRR